MITQTNFLALIKEGIGIKNSYNTVRNANKFLERLEEEEGEGAFESLGIDDNFIAGILTSNGMFNLMVLFLH